MAQNKVLHDTLTIFKHQLLKALADAKGISLQGMMANNVIVDKLHQHNDTADYNVSSGLQKNRGLYKNLNHDLTNAINNLKPSDNLCLIGQSILTLAPYLRWYQRQPTSYEAPYSEPFISNHANALLIGPQGLEKSRHLAIGLTLIAPNITYVDHQHPPEEVYLVLSDGDWRQEKRPWHTPNIGGFVYNPPNIIHAMRSKDKPLLAIWCLNINA